MGLVTTRRPTTPHNFPYRELASQGVARFTTVGTLLLVLGLALAAAQTVQAQSEIVLHSFAVDGADGYHPYATLVIDSRRNLYGTTLHGGSHGFGTVFKISASGTERVLYSFAGGTDGVQPSLGVIRDNAGNLYGTTFDGGTGSVGTVFKLDSFGSHTVVHNFMDDGTDGYRPNGDLVRDAAGNLYGTTQIGGAFGFGTVFKLTAAGIETVLYSFAGGADGCNPNAGLIRSKGKLYGTTVGCGAFGHGTVFRVTLSGAESVLHSFAQDGADGYEPYCQLVADAAGNLYGTTLWGGVHGIGAVFRVTPTGAENVLYSFGGSDGYHPYGGLVLDAAGNLYGTTNTGGDFGYGTVFSLTPSGVHTLIHSFTPNGTDGLFPYSGLVRDRLGILYGTTLQGGSGSSMGTVFKVTP